MFERFSGGVWPPGPPYYMISLKCLSGLVDRGLGGMFFAAHHFLEEGA